MIEIAIINRSTAASDLLLAGYVGPLQTQISRDFAPQWGSDAHLQLLAAGAAPPPGLWQCLVLDHSDVDGDLGYHLYDGGVPGIDVFAADDLAVGASLSVTLSHELLEMLADPTANLTVRGPAGNTYVREVCDPVEADDDGYDIDGVRVSNFVLPRYFGMSNTAGPGDARCDFRGRLAGPLPALRPGGYQMYQPPNATSWQSIMAHRADGGLGNRAIARHGRRRFRAARPPA